MRADGASPALRWRHGVSFLAVTCAVGLIAAVVFLGFPGIDLSISRLFFYRHLHFLVTPTNFGNLLRQGFQLLFIAGCVTAALGTALSVIRRRKWLALGFPQWLFVTICLVLGPGILSNVILKDHWGRARPFYVEQFGGPAHFTPALAWSDQCHANCSFVCGEAASIFALFFALAFVFPRSRTKLLALGLIAGSAAGLIRVAAGGHFLSDVVFAGVFMALVVRGVYWLMFELGAPIFAEGGALQRRLHLADGKRADASLQAGRADVFANRQTSPASDAPSAPAEE